MKPRTQALLVVAGAAAALPVLLASLAHPGAATPRTNPPLPTGLANSVYAFAEKDGHPEWAVLREQRQDTTPYLFGHAKHMAPEGFPRTQEALAAIRDGKSPAGTATGRAAHVVAAADGKLAMSCTFCHETDEAGRYMVAIDFETHCVDCHTATLGVVGARGSALATASAGINDAGARRLVRPAAVPHETSAQVALVIERALGQWVADQPPQYPKAEPAPGGEGAAPAAGEKPAEPAPEGGGRRRRGGSSGSTTTPPADASATSGGDAATPAADKPADAPAAAPSGGRRRGGGGGAEAKPADAGPVATLPAFKTQAELTAWLGKQRQELLGKIEQNSCAYCHQQITPGPGQTPELFVISDQKIPEVWLPRSVFSHAAHGMVSCVSCHPQALTGEKTTDVMLPGIASCRECHGSEGDVQGAPAPHDCVECHVFHQRLPAAAQGGLTIEAVRGGGRVVMPKAKP